MIKPVNGSSNLLLASLKTSDRERVLAASRHVTLNVGEVVTEPGTPRRYAWFPTNGFMTLVTSVGDSPAVEVGMVGREGMLGIGLALGMPSAPLHAVVRAPGEAWRIERKAFRALLADCPALKQLLDRYAWVVMTQTAAAAACTRFHQIGPRLARWLLMTQDRLQSDSFHATHDFLGYIMGVRRAGISGAAVALQRQGIIRYKRGDVTVLDRRRLEQAACACYSYGRDLHSSSLPR